ncbi:MAG: hypothetical protein AB4080_19685 [Trichodesmium sp.]
MINNYGGVRRQETGDRRRTRIRVNPPLTPTVEGNRNSGVRSFLSLIIGK